MIYLIALIATAALLRETTTLEHWIAFDAWVLRVLTLGKSKPGETISAAAWDMHLAGKTRGHVLVAVINWIFKVRQADHCRKAWEWQRHLYESKI